MIPATVRRAGLLVALEGVVGIAYAITFVVEGFSGGDKKLSFGTAGYLVIMSGAVLAAGWALLTGRRWGRGLAVFAQLVVVGLAYYAIVGSHQWLIGVPLGIVAVAALVFLFSPSTLRWATRQGDSDASSDNSGPDTR